ncbi:MAG: squalene/phytoene synthase family protein [Caldilineaceae bacterium]|nr:squalene/phytoene synthase family protein [Caldilineaceae bacterium]
MTLKSHSWEHPLLSLAHEAWHSASTPPVLPIQSAAELEQAYAHCDSLTSVHSRSFHMASHLLPPTKRRAARALYAFCRVTDDIVDEIPIHTVQDVDAVRTSLDEWRRRALSANADISDPVIAAWTDTRARYHIPQRYAEQLIAGVAQDLAHRRYQTFEELSAYCYGVASTVGLMSMCIIGFAGPQAIPYAVKLGVALQMTNILRDVGEDWRSGRLYLPQEELAAYDLGEEDIDAGRVDERWRAFMRFQIARNRQIYAEAWSGIALLDNDGRFSIAAAADLYRGILDDIEAHDYDVFSRRSYVTTWGKVRRLPTIWWRSRSVRLPALS